MSFEIIRKSPVKVGDRFYRKTLAMTVPDRLEVIDVQKGDGCNIIIGRYMYHAIGHRERRFSDKIFDDPNWIIERKGIDF